MSILISLQLVVGLLLSTVGIFHCQALSPRYTFVVEETSYKRLCSTKNILTVNGQFPGPTLYARAGDTVIVDVYNKGNRNITLHWHGVKQPRNPWSDGPNYITQCPIQPGARFTQTIIFSSEEGTLWWHAHSEWDRATVHGAIVIYPKKGATYPFTKPHAELPIILGEWWKEDIGQLYDETIQSGGDPNNSDAYLINGEYNRNSSSTPTSFPNLPSHNDTKGSVHFTSKLKSLADKNHPVDVPHKITTPLFFTLSINTLPCPSNSCTGPNGTRFATSINNISFVDPTIDILQAYYFHVNGAFGTRFPNFPPLLFNFTAQDLPLYLQTPKQATEVKILEYNSTVEIVFQGTNLVGGDDHPMHLHGFSFYVVGRGLGNFDKDKDPLTYNLVDPPLQNTIAVPINGWTTIRFKADNPGVWFMHCHLDRHMSWGMDMTFIVKNGKGPGAQMLPPPQGMPPC
ncbi:hypothetical protein C1H46_034298 [Malus baccata]|uniref:Laccase n=1 Tax=Malus baccata TaxID=106549 RepID=A0A540L154_MALBA|nr:hypothetical protein C1H46_034298 [Malus baccata]